ncbi:MAG: OB-fold nucleic acid binding domain-containing protein [Synergistaceae bacterium]|nr:OB-fold nucleic acid binding domain-containing protein [Synergistaceae bacterium]
MVQENSVTVSGQLHFIGTRKEHKYFPFSIRHENAWTDGTTRRDFLTARAFPAEIQEKLKSLEEGAPIKVEGVLRSSRGSGELYLAVLRLEDGQPGTLENTVKLSGLVHLIKAQAEGETGTGKYTRFAVRQDNQELDGSPRRDFLVVRVYDQGLRDTLATKQDGDPVSVEGALRSSRGSGVNYVRCSAIQ